MLRRLAIACSVLLLQAAAYGRVLPPPATIAPAPATMVALQADEKDPEREPGPANLEEAIQIALKRYGGEAASANTVVRDGKEVHEIRVLGEDGRVRLVRIDPETGAIIPQRRRPD
jgi:uncharacterized membrane protein YkoI